MKNNWKNRKIWTHFSHWISFNPI